MKNNSRSSLIFIGPIALKGKAALGGFESANRNMIDFLERNDIEVKEKRYPDARSNILKKLSQYLLRYLNIYISCILMRKKDILCATPMNRRFIFLELIYFIIAKFKKNKIIIIMKGGRQIDDYNRFSSIYKLLYRFIIRTANLVFYEIKDYSYFEKYKSNGAKFIYLPNCSEHIHHKNNKQSHSFLYVGLINEDKGCLHAINTFKKIKNSLINAELNFVGRCSRGMQEKINQNKHLDINYLGEKSVNELKDIYAKHQFFIFLSKYYGEGQSVALTESLNYGCIPIVTIHRGNADVIGEYGIAFEDRDNFEQNSKQIINYIKTSNLHEQKEYYINHFKKNYSNDFVLKRFLDGYKILVKD